MSPFALQQFFLGNSKSTRLEVVVGAVFLLFWCFVIGMVVISMTINLDQALLTKYGYSMLKGFSMTIGIVVLTVPLGFFLGLPIAFARLSRKKLIRGAAYCYVYLFRGTPLLVQLFLVYYGSGQIRPTLETWGLWWFFREPFYCVAFAFTLNTAAYQGEILKGAILSVPRGQIEAAKSLGISPLVTFYKVVTPQGLVLALRPLGNELILMVKSSALASIVTIFDLMGATKLAFSRSYNFDVYLWAAIIYLCLTEFIRVMLMRINARLTRHLTQDN